MIELTAYEKPVFTIDIPTVGAVMCRTCSYRDYEALRLCSEQHLGDIIRRICIDDTPEMLISVQKIFAKKYLDALHEYKTNNKNVLEIPYDGTPPKPEEICRLDPVTQYDKLVSDYTGLNFLRIGGLNIIDYWLMLADAYKLMVLRNKLEPVKYLNGCYCYMNDLFSPDTPISSGDEITIM